MQSWIQIKKANPHQCLRWGSLFTRQGPYQCSLQQWRSDQIKTLIHRIREKFPIIQLNLRNSMARHAERQLLLQTVLLGMIIDIDLRFFRISVTMLLFSRRVTRGVYYIHTRTGIARCFALQCIVFRMNQFHRAALVSPRCLPQIQEAFLVRTRSRSWCLFDTCS